MARPRFLRLPAEQQQAILGAALDEFATHGFAGASLNRIIETAGISKGAMYYYFDGKDDLYADVLRRQLEELLREGGAMPVPSDSGTDAFWSTLQDHYLRLFRLLAASAPTAALLRDWLSGPGGRSLWAAQQEAAAATMPWLTQTVEAGRRAGAVRDDIPPDLIIAMAMGMGQAMDAWLITTSPDDLAPAIAMLVGMLRRALGPD